MNSRDLDTQSAPNKWWAAQDARMRNFAMSTKYTESQKIQAERMKLGLDMVYSSPKEIFINYRKRFIAIKIEKPTVRDRQNLKLLEAEYAERGIVKKVTAQGIIYEIPNKG